MNSLGLVEQITSTYPLNYVLDLCSNDLFTFGADLVQCKAKAL